MERENRLKGVSFGANLPEVYHSRVCEKRRIARGVKKPVS